MFYLYEPEDERPRGRLIRFKTLQELRERMRDRPGSMRVYFLDIGTAFNTNDAVDIDTIPWPVCGHKPPE